MTIQAQTVHLKSNPKHAIRNVTAKSAPLLCSLSADATYTISAITVNNQICCYRSVDTTLYFDTHSS